MKINVRAVVGCALTSVLAGTACSDVSTAPLERSGAEPAQLLGTITGLLAPPVHRLTPLANDVTWSFTAGPNGAASSNAYVGLTIVIPRGALSTTQTITVTALQGSPVAYAFAPHLEFNSNIYLTQNLRGTTAGSLLSLPLLKGAHFEGDRLQLIDGLALVDEIVSALVNPLTKTVTFGVKHFSGWIVISGNGEPQGDGAQ